MLTIEIKRDDYCMAAWKKKLESFCPGCGVYIVNRYMSCHNCNRPL